MVEVNLGIRRTIRIAVESNITGQTHSRFAFTARRFQTLKIMSNPMSGLEAAVQHLGQSWPPRTSFRSSNKMVGAESNGHSSSSLTETVDERLNERYTDAGNSFLDTAIKLCDNLGQRCGSPLFGVIAKVTTEAL